MTMRASRATACSRCRSKMLVPVPGDIDAARYPYFVVARNVIQEALERQSAARPSDQSAMQAYRHHLGRAEPSLFIEAIEAVPEIGQELVAAVEALRCRKAHVVGIERIGNDEMDAALRSLDPIG